MNKIPTPDAIQLLREALDRLERPSPNGNGGTMQVGGAFWRLAKVLADFLDPILEHHEGAAHASHIRESLRPLCALLFGVDAAAREAPRYQLFDLDRGELSVRADDAVGDALLRGGRLLLEQAFGAVELLIDLDYERGYQVMWWTDLTLTQNGEVCENEQFHGSLDIEDAITKCADGEVEELDRLEKAFAKAFANVRSRLADK